MPSQDLWKHIDIVQVILDDIKRQNRLCLKEIHKWCTRCASTSFGALVELSHAPLGRRFNHLQQHLKEMAPCRRWNINSPRRDALGWWCCTFFKVDSDCVKRCSSAFCSKFVSWNFWKNCYDSLHSNKRKMLEGILSSFVIARRQQWSSRLQRKKPRWLRRKREKQRNVRQKYLDTDCGYMILTS